MTVAEIRRASRMSRGMDSASARAAPLARCVARTSCLSRRRLAAITLSDARFEPAYHRFHALAVGAGGKGERHAMLEYRLGHIDDVVDRRRQATIDERARTRREHECLARTRTRPPGDQLADVPGLGTGPRCAHKTENCL